MTEQSQKSGDQSTNIQAEQITINLGVTKSEAKEIALGVLKANFLELSGEARSVAQLRGEEITEKFLSVLSDRYPEGLKQARDPDFQYSLFNLQKEYAKSGDKQLGDLLVDLLVDRTKQEQRSILQIVLNESLVVAPKLTDDQLATLSVVFLFVHTTSPGLSSLPTLLEYFDKFVKPFVGLLTTKNSCYQHLEYAGCGSVGMQTRNLGTLIRNPYPGLFSKGFDQEDMKKMEIVLLEDSSLVTKCLHDSNKLQVNAMNDEMLKEKAAREGLPDSETNKLLSLFPKFRMSEDEVLEFIKNSLGFMAPLIDLWPKSAIRGFNLSSVGIAIGHANVKKNVGEFTDLSIWIN